MIWLTWRQFRGQAIATAAVLGAFAIVLAVTGPHLWNLYASSGLDGCHSGCGSAAATFTSEARITGSLTMLYACLAVMCLAPAMIGIFWGAPLIARELETGTFRLAWNQSVTRSRWTLAKFGLLALTAMATTGLLSLMTGSWSKPYTAALAASPGSGAISSGRLSPVLFASTGVAPVGYAAFAFALGATAGLLTRRSIAAMAITLAGFTAVQLAWPTWIRPHLLPPVTKTLALSLNAINQLTINNGRQMTVVASYSHPGAWILSDKTITPAGHLFTGPATQACQGNSSRACNAWLASQHLRQLVTYQPASRYWPLQWEEAAIFIVLAALLAGLSVWLIRRRA